MKKLLLTIVHQGGYYNLPIIKKTTSECHKDQNINI